ncbi:MAG: tyrosine-type recombinase/integrase [Cytophagales bacterium]|nr:tyrosine-type recombinase/integrase [Cytophagales bacterium]
MSSDSSCLGFFLRYLLHEKRVSPHTYSAYKEDLKQADVFLQSRFSIGLEEGSFRLLRAWVLSLSEGGMQPRSINRKIASLKSFYKFLFLRERISENPARLLRSLKTESRLPSFLREKETAEEFTTPHFGSDFAGQRDRLIFELLYGTGIRCAELISLREADIFHTQHMIRVWGKGNKERVIPIPETLSRLLDDYLRLKSSSFPTSTDTLVLTNKGKKTYPMFIYRTVQHYLGLFSSVQKKSPHLLRHTYATHLLERGADLNAIKALLGHSSLSATQVYTHNTLHKVKRVYKETHPKA